MTRPLIATSSALGDQDLGLIDPPVRVCVLEDSTAELNVGWPEAFREIANADWGIGGDGLHMMSRDEWAFSSGWTAATSADVWDLAPYRGVFLPPPAAAYRALGSSSRVVTWTNPSSRIPPVAGFVLHMIVGPTGTLPPSFRIDGTGSWRNIPGPWDNQVRIHRVQFNLPITTTLEVRAADANGTATDTYIIGVEPLAASSGSLIVDNLGASSETLFDVTRTSTNGTVNDTDGQWDAWLQLVQPNIVICCYTNDIVLQPFFPSNLDFLIAYRHSADAVIESVLSYGGSPIMMNFMEQNGRDVTIQAQCREVMKEAARDHGTDYVDLYDLVGGGFDVANADGFMIDSLHPTASGQSWIARNIYQHIKRLL